MLNKDYKDLLHALNEANATFLLVGAYALAAHGYPRACASPFLLLCDCTHYVIGI